MATPTMALGAQDYLKPTRVYLKGHPSLNERWVQDRIAEDPSILGLGDDLILRDKERTQPQAGRLDLLLQDSEKRRYEVEIQLGSSDESHIIRTIEYWDIEWRRYPQHDHCAVLVAEDVTSRFLNILALFNGSIPFIALQMQALKVGEHLTLVFTTVLDEFSRGFSDEDEEIQPVADRGYWEARGFKQALSTIDRVLEVAREIDPKLDVKYNKAYVAGVRDGHVDNFISFEPRKNGLIMNVKVAHSNELQNEIEQSKIVVADYNKRYGQFRLKLDADAVLKSRDELKRLITLAYDGRKP